MGDFPLLAYHTGTWIPLFLVCTPPARPGQYGNGKSRIFLPEMVLADYCAQKLRRFNLWCSFRQFWSILHHDGWLLSSSLFSLVESPFFLIESLLVWVESLFLWVESLFLLAESPFIFWVKCLFFLKLHIKKSKLELQTLIYEILVFSGKGTIPLPKFTLSLR